MENNTVIISFGCTTPIGYTAQETAASVRSGITRFNETTYLDRIHDPIVMSCFPTEALPPADPLIMEFPGISIRQARMLQMAGSALTEAVINIPKIDDYPIFLGMPEVPVENESLHNQDFLNLLSIQSTSNFNFSASRLYPNGRAAAVLALNDAINLLEANVSKFIIVGGCDSYWDLNLLKTLDCEGRISSSLNLDGFIPGEGAGFIVLCSLKTAERYDLDILGVIGGVGLGFENGHRYSENVFMGTGLADACSNLYSNTHRKDLVRTAYVSFNGESLHAKEWGVSYIRNSDRFSDDIVIEHPADCLGDTGSASGVIMAVLSIIGISRKYVDGPCLVLCTSDYGNCGVYTLNFNF